MAAHFSLLVHALQYKKTLQLDYFYGPKSKINVLTNETDFFFNHVYLYSDDGYFGDIKSQQVTQHYYVLYILQIWL